MLAGNGISDKGAKVLANAVKVNSRIQELDLFGTNPHPSRAHQFSSFRAVLDWPPKALFATICDIYMVASYP